ncbi:hypothetical protein TrLO_g5994 [Triparma laevis f. longispina]|uniref:Uncharacterized protein n=1 Tax=Triparma laevis f. longispina TaxID=1714387 RepID=A0A9W7C0I8_9STRA|nr:hypothetical protein TrLO_g5994 [Triparma laevis f. longispina]
MLEAVAYDDISSDYLWGKNDRKFDRQESSFVEGVGEKSTVSEPIREMEERVDPIDIGESSEDRPVSAPTSLHAKHLSTIESSSTVDNRDTLTTSLTSTPVTFKGYLLKKSPSIFKGWQKRFVVIGDNRLKYSVEEGMETKGEVPLTGVKINWNILPKSAPPVYELTIIPTLEPMRTFCFRTGSGMDKELVDVVLRESVEGRNLERVLKLLREKDSDHEDDDEEEDDGKKKKAKKKKKGEEEEALKPWLELSIIYKSLESTSKSRISSYIHPKSQNTLLHTIASHSSTHSASIILPSFPSSLLNCRNRDEHTALMVSLLNANDELSLMLLDLEGIDPSSIGSNGDTYLSYASTSSSHTISRLLSLRVSPKTLNLLGTTCLHEMSVSNNDEGISTVLEAEPGIINVQSSKDGLTPLHWSARAGTPLSLKCLVDSGADIGITSFLGDTALHSCIAEYVKKSKEKKNTRNMKYHKNYSTCIIKLVESGSELEECSKEGRTALSALCRIQPEFVQKKFGGEAAISKMLEMGAKVNVRSSRGLTPVHYAAVSGNWALVKLLVEYGADVNLMCTDGYTALGSLERKTKKVGARALYGTQFALMEQTIKILLESGAIRRTHKDVPLEENTGDITFIRNHNDGTYMMKAANVKAMVSRLTHRVFYDSKDVRSFLLMYHRFTTAIEVLKHLQTNFFPRNNDGDFGGGGVIDLNLLGGRRSVLCFLENWLASNDGNPLPFVSEDSECTVFLAEFVEQIMDTKCLINVDSEMEKVVLPFFGDFAQCMHPTMWKERWQEQHRFLTIKDGRRVSVMSETSHTTLRSLDYTSYDEVLMICSEPSEKATKLLGVDSDEKTLKDYTPQELAQQLTLMVHAIFCEINVEEFVDSRYKSVETGPNFQRLKQATNKLSFILISSILSEPDMTERALRIKTLIQTAENCLTCENFDMFVSIISVLGSSAIHRLKQTWAKVHKMLPGKWDAMQKASGGAGRNLEKKMGVLKPPCVPCIGLVLRMLINLDEEPDYIDDKKVLINFHKLRKMGVVYSMIESAKSVPYSFKSESGLLRLLTGTPEYGNEDQCWNRSREIEAKVKT